MSRRAALFTKADLNRALSVARKHGADVTVDILRDGTIRLQTTSKKEGSEGVLGGDESPRVMF